ncbi:MAG TPA: YccF domain-containing protein [Azospirillaceae bacterium]|nr:YccF domain-containing protein [Azospirillaceae bacterium]
MGPVSLILNILWLVFGGVWMALGWGVAALVLAITIVGIPWARAAFTIAIFVLLPFGREAVARDRLTGEEDIGTGALGFLGNVIWFVLAGWWLALLHLVTGIMLMITIIGIPFGWQHVKFAGISLAPVGKTIVDKDDPRLRGI